MVCALVPPTLVCICASPLLTRSSSAESVVFGLSLSSSSAARAEIGLSLDASVLASWRCKLGAIVCCSWLWISFSIAASRCVPAAVAVVVVVVVVVVSSADSDPRPRRLVEPINGIVPGIMNPDGIPEPPS